MIRLVLGTLAAVAVLTVGTVAQEPSAAGDDIRERILTLIRAGDDAAALEACRLYTGRNAHDLVMRYNQACLELRSGLEEDALGTLRDVVRDGYDDVDHMAADPDLAQLADDPRFLALLTEMRSRLVLAAAERGLTLSMSAPGELPLRCDVPSPVSSRPRLTLAWRPDALELRLDAPAGTYAPDATRLIATLGLPDPVEPYLARTFFVFAFGTDAKGAGWGALWVPSTGHWQRVAELRPREVVQGLPVTVAIPWSLIQPLHPLTDPSLGINVTLDARSSPGEAWLLFSAIADPAWSEPLATTRRVVRLDFAPDGVAGPAFLGRVADSIVAGDVLDFELVAAVPLAGPGTLRIDFRDNRGRSVLPGGPVAGTLDLKAGLQRLPRQASFAGLRTGSYQLRTELGFPGGTEAVWSATILNLAPGWADSFALRADEVAALDRPTVDYYLRSVRAAVAEHVPRRHPGPIAKTLGDLDAMLARSAATGSILPVDGPGLIVYPGPAGDDRLCTLYRPAPGSRRGAETPVLILGDAPGGEEAVASRFARFYEYGDLAGAGDLHPLYLIPQLPARNREAEARAVLEFVRRRFTADAVSLVGVNAGGGVALRLAAADGDGLSRLMVLAGGHLDPWPGATDAELAAELASIPRTLPVAWTDFTRETAYAGDAPRVLQTLKAQGAAVTSREAGGGLGLSQAADRIVLWAEDLPVPGRE